MEGDSTASRLLIFFSHAVVARRYVEIGMAKPSDAVIDEQLVKDIAAAHGKTPAQVVLRWAIQLGKSLFGCACLSWHSIVADQLASVIERALID